MEFDINTVISAARAGGKVARKYFGQSLKTEEKSGLNDLRTKADTESEDAILKVLRSAYPDINIYAEESGQFDKGSEYTFVVDPLDGTSNFVLGMPNFTVSIGLLKGDDAVLGVIFVPVLDQVYSAERGKGARLNGSVIHVNNEGELGKSSVGITVGYQTPYQFTEQLTKKLIGLGVKRVVDDWSPAFYYCLLASGRIEAMVSKEGDLEDYVAAKAIMTEAGANISSMNGSAANGRDSDFIASNGTTIHESIQSLL